MCKAQILSVLNGDAARAMCNALLPDEAKNCSFRYWCKYFYNEYQHVDQGTLTTLTVAADFYPKVWSFLGKFCIGHLNIDKWNEVNSRINAGEAIEGAKEFLELLLRLSMNPLIINRLDVRIYKRHVLQRFSEKRKISQGFLYRTFRSCPHSGLLDPSGPMFLTNDNFILVAETPADSFCFRGDDRSLGVLKGQKGFLCKADSENYWRTKCNGEAAWNPLNSVLFDPTAPDSLRNIKLKDLMYFRPNNCDNCLFTAVSITPLGQDDELHKLRVNACFPLPESGWLSGPDARKKVEVVLLKEQSGRIIEAKKSSYYCDIIAIFYCRIPSGTAILNTEATQRFLSKPGFPERAVRGIPYDDILACACFLRLHPEVRLGAEPNKETGYTVFPITTECQFRRNNRVAREKLMTFISTGWSAKWKTNGAELSSSDFFGIESKLPKCLLDIGGYIGGYISCQGNRARISSNGFVLCDSYFLSLMGYKPESKFANMDFDCFQTNEVDWGGRDRHRVIVSIK